MLTEKHVSHLKGGTQCEGNSTAGRPGPGLPRGNLDEILIGVLRCWLQVLQHGLELGVIALVDVVPDDGKLPTHLPHGAGGMGAR